jgi:hypothetical protein
MSHISAKEEASTNDDSLVPKSPRQERLEKAGTLFAGKKKSFSLFGGGDSSKKSNADAASGVVSKSVNVNSQLWQASMDMIAFMPLAISDTAGGVIVTDWYEDPDYPAERYKVNVLIKSTELKPNALQITVFKQELKDGVWRAVKANAEISEDIEDKIFTRARELKLAQQH